MPTFIIELIPGGYLIYMDGEPYIMQDFDPEKQFIDGVPQPFDSEAAAQAHADAVIADALKAYEPQPDPDPVPEPEQPAA